jgi:hypothetical protein
MWGQAFPRPARPKPKDLGFDVAFARVGTECESLFGRALARVGTAASAVQAERSSAGFRDPQFVDKALDLLLADI